MTGFFTPWISGGALAGSAVFSYPGRNYVLNGLMLFLPLLDRHWSSPSWPRASRNYFFWAGLLIVTALLLAWQPHQARFALVTLLLAAVPEEWFFRGYFMMRMGRGWPANLVTSLLFSLLHGLVHDWMTALRVFIPSLVYGWLYQRTKDLPLLILVHALSNLVFVIFVRRILAA
jgi:membrane protease YdiL (CAAX protease family)